jgi:hypothetical protein
MRGDALGEDRAQAVGEGRLLVVEQLRGPSRHQRLADPRDLHRTVLLWRRCQPAGRRVQTRRLKRAVHAVGLERPG